MPVIHTMVAAASASSQDAAELSFVERSDRAGILHVIQHCEPSGAELCHLPLLLADPNPLLACPPNSATETLAHAHGIPTVPLAYRQLRQSAGVGELLRSVVRGLRSAHDLRRVLRAHPDRPIVVGNTLTPSMLISLASLGLTHKPVWIAAQFLRRRTVRAAVRVLALLTAARVVVPSRAVYERFVDGSRPLAKRTRVAQPGVDLERFGDPVEAQGPYVALVGYISPVKRTELGLAIASRVAERVPGFKLLVVGSAQYTPEDRAFEEALRHRVETDSVLKEHVDFRGHVRDVPALLSTVSALLHCCPAETFGMVLVEAMAAGLPVVAPGAGGPLEIVEDGVTGLLYSPDDVDAAADHLARVLADDRLARELGNAGRARAERLFSASAYVARFSQALEGLDG